MKTNADLVMVRIQDLLKLDYKGDINDKLSMYEYVWTWKQKNTNSLYEIIDQLSSYYVD